MRSRNTRNRFEAYQSSTQSLFGGLCYSGCWTFCSSRLRLIQAQFKELEVYSGFSADMVSSFGNILWFSARSLTTACATCLVK